MAAAAPQSGNGGLPELLALLHLRVDALLLLGYEQLQLVHVEKLVEEKIRAFEHFDRELVPRELLDFLKIQLDLVLELLARRLLRLRLLLMNVVVDDLQLHGRLLNLELD